jgi:hypothetical protein
VANGWLRVGLGATDLSVHRSLGSTVFAVGDDYAHTSRHIVSLCVFSCDMITFDESCVRRREGEIILSPEGGGRAADSKLLPRFAGFCKAAQTG